MRADLTWEVTPGGQKGSDSPSLITQLVGVQGKARGSSIPMVTNTYTKGQ